MKRSILLAIVLMALAAPSFAACINTQAGDWDDCSERRGAREPASWCGGGGGSSPGGGWRQRQAEQWEEKVAEIKGTLATIFGGLTFKPSHEID
jgi:predicted small secreted protein